MHKLTWLGLIFLTITLSSLPVLIWSIVFLYRSREKRHIVFRTFFLGAVMVIPLITYKSLWTVFPALNLLDNFKFLADFKFMDIGMHLIAFYASVGLIEEWAKSRIVHTVERSEINSISDAIEFSIMVALGFAFAENTFYFIQVYNSYGVDMLLNTFIVRSLFSTFAHILFSALYGYHYGLSVFSAEVLKSADKPRDKKSIIKFKKDQRFTGLIYAVLLHAMFNLMLELGITIFLLPFLLVGVIHVLLLIYNQANMIQYRPREDTEKGPTLIKIVGPFKA